MKYKNLIFGHKKKRRQLSRTPQKTGKGACGAKDNLIIAFNVLGIRGYSQKAACDIGIEYSGSARQKFLGARRTRPLR